MDFTSGLYSRTYLTLCSLYGPGWRMFCVASTSVLQKTTSLLIYLSPVRSSTSSIAPGLLGLSISSMMHPCCGLQHVLDFFGFLRAGEFICPSLCTYTPRMLSPAEVTVDSRDSPSVVSICLRQSKTTHSERVSLSILVEPDRSSAQWWWSWPTWQGEGWLWVISSSFRMACHSQNRGSCNAYAKP